MHIPLAIALGWAEILLILLVLLLLFGTTRLPKLGRSIGKTIVEFKSGMAEAKAVEGPKDEQKALENKQQSPAPPGEEASEKTGASES